MCCGKKDHSATYNQLLKKVMDGINVKPNITYKQQVELKPYIQVQRNIRRDKVLQHDKTVDPTIEQLKLSIQKNMRTIPNKAYI